MKKVLYITYDGLTDALGQSQVLSYLTRLSSPEIKILIISFEKKKRSEDGGKETELILKEKDIEWNPLKYTKNPPIFSTYFDIQRGKATAVKIFKKQPFAIVHCRGYISAIIGLYLKKRYGVKFIFDMRGWWPDEKLESGFWNKPIYMPVYRYFKKLEKEFFSKADFVVSLTEAGKKEIIKQGLAKEVKIGVIPTCVDFSLFKPFNDETRVNIREELGIPLGAKVLLYSGSLGGNYDTNHIIRIFEAFSKQFQDAHLMILSKDTLSRAEMETLISNRKVTITNSPFNKVSDYLMAGDVALIIYKHSFSVIGRSPTKLGEYWATGLPVISIKKIGDLDDLYNKFESGGVLLNSDLSDCESEIKKLYFVDKAQLRQSAISYFDVDKGVNFYRNVYKSLNSINEK